MNKSLLGNSSRQYGLAQQSALTPCASLNNVRDKLGAIKLMLIWWFGCLPSKGSCYQSCDKKELDGAKHL
eukprot:697348-Pelagomonas_calceolata.AAC.1